MREPLMEWGRWSALHGTYCKIHSNVPDVSGMMSLWKTKTLGTYPAQSEVPINACLLFYL